jgi:retinol dehydrogenase-13
MASLRFVVTCVGVCSGIASGTSCSESETANDLAASFNLAGKVAIVTGGDSGLGFAAAESLARQGATVVVAGHSAKKSEIAAEQLRNTTSADVRALPLDLASFANVRAFVDRFLKAFDKLHYLINDAGIGHAMGSGAKTEDGFEQVFQVNYLGHFLLTELLLPSLRKSSPSRVVNVASVMHMDACHQAGFPSDCAKDFTYIPPPMTTVPNNTIYGFSKLMMIEHAAELNAREAAAGVTAYSLCPGLVVTGMTKDHPEIFQMCKLYGPAFQKPCPYNAQQGAAVIAYAALGDLKPGLWYERRAGCSASSITPHGFTDAMRPDLYIRSQKMVGLMRSQGEAVVV